MKHRIIPIFIPQMGCPFQCIFCNQHIISGEKNEITFERITNQIKEGIEVNNGSVEVAFYGGNFTAIDIFYQKRFLEIANSFGNVKSIRISTRPDCINKEILYFLKEYNVKTIELGIQSMFDEVLMACNRGHTSNDNIKAMELIKEFDFILGVQVMAGLPQSNFEKDIETVRKVVKYKPDIARIYPTLVIKDTYLEKMFKEGKYKPLDLEDAIYISAKMKLEFILNNVKVIRTGLQATDEINCDKDVIAGPFHPAFGELVDSEIIYNIIINSIEEKGINTDYIEIYSHTKNISKIIGINKCNIYRFKSQKNIIVKVIQNETINIEKIVINSFNYKPYEIYINNL
ncbi:elongator complex protein 3 [Caldicellulosiruptoraceae bacterium PP1]